MDTIILEPKIQLAQIASNCKLENRYNSSIMGIGMYNINNVYRILFKIPIKKVPQDAEIVHVKLKLILISNRSKCTNIVTPYALIDNWNLNTVEWDNQPDFNPEIFGENVNVKRGARYVFDITSLVQKWHRNEIPNYGIILKNKEIKNRTFVKTIADIREQYGPVVEIFYKTKSSCESTCTKFIEKIEELYTNDLYSFSKIRNTSLTKTVIFFVRNLEIHEITAHLQVSPDGVNFINEPMNISVGMNKIKFIVPCIFAQFTRVAVRNIYCGETSKVKVWYQAQE